MNKQKAVVRCRWQAIGRICAASCGRRVGHAFHTIPPEAMIRSHFPALSRLTYLNTAGGAPIPDQVRVAAETYYREAHEDGDVHWDRWMGRVDAARAEVGLLMGSSPEAVAFLGNASAGLNLAAALDTPGSFAYAASEFPSCTLPWMRRGFRPIPWQVASDGSFTVADIRAVLEQDTRVVVVSWVQFGTGFRADLTDIGRLCRQQGMRLVVDATQAIGAFPLDIVETGADVLVFSGYKWLTSGYGVAGFVLPGGFPEGGSPFAGWRSQQNPYGLIADRLDPDWNGRSAEGGHPPFSGAFSMGAAARFWRHAGPEETSTAILKLAHRIHQGMDRTGIEVLSSRDPDSMSGIVMLGVPDPAGTAARLKDQGIVTSARRAGLRVSVHAYNTAEEVDRLVGALRDLGHGQD